MEAKAEGITTYQVKHWEFAALSIEAILLGAAMAALAMVAGPRLSESLFPLPRAVWFGLGIGLIGIVLYPVLSAQVRNVYGHNFTFAKAMIGALVAALLAGLLNAFLG